MGVCFAVYVAAQGSVVQLAVGTACTVDVSYGGQCGAGCTQCDYVCSSPSCTHVVVCKSGVPATFIVDDIGVSQTFKGATIHCELASSLFLYAKGTQQSFDKAAIYAPVGGPFHFEIHEAQAFDSVESIIFADNSTDVLIEVYNGEINKKEFAEGSVYARFARNLTVVSKGDTPQIGLSVEGISLYCPLFSADSGWPTCVLQLGNDAVIRTVSVYANRGTPQSVKVLCNDADSGSCQGVTVYCQEQDTGDFDNSCVMQYSGDWQCQDDLGSGCNRPFPPTTTMTTTPTTTTKMPTTTATTPTTTKTPTTTTTKTPTTTTTPSTTVVDSTTTTTAPTSTEITSTKVSTTELTTRAPTTTESPTTTTPLTPSTTTVDSTTSKSAPTSTKLPSSTPQSSMEMSSTSSIAPPTTGMPTTSKTTEAVTSAPTHASTVSTTKRTTAAPMSTESPKTTSKMPATTKATDAQMSSTVSSTASASTDGRTTAETTVDGSGDGKSNGFAVGSELLIAIAIGAVVCVLLVAAELYYRHVLRNKKNKNLPQRVLSMDSNAPKAESKPQPDDGEMEAIEVKTVSHLGRFRAKTDEQRRIEAEIMAETRGALDAESKSGSEPLPDTGMVVINVENVSHLGRFKAKTLEQRRIEREIMADTRGAFDEKSESLPEDVTKGGTPNGDAMSDEDVDFEMMYLEMPKRRTPGAPPKRSIFP